MSRKKPEREKKREMREAARAAEAEKENGPGWEIRSIKFALRMVAVFFFIGYVLMTIPASWTWVQTKWVLHYPLEALPAKADYYLNKTFEPEKLYKIVSMRPVSETEKMIPLLEPYTGRMSTYTFLLYSLRLKSMGKIDDALFWWQFARYRARFDALRCGSNEAVENLKELLQIVPHPEFPPDDKIDEMTVVKSIKKVLELDAKYPAENIPEDLCEPLRALEEGKFASVGVDRWRDIRYSLRVVTEARVTKMDDELKKGKRTVNETKELSVSEYMHQLTDPLKKFKDPFAAPVGDDGKIDQAACSKMLEACKKIVDKCTADKGDCTEAVQGCQKLETDCKKKDDAPEDKNGDKKDGKKDDGKGKK